MRQPHRDPSGSASPTVGAALACYRLAMRLYPTEFRREFAAALVADVADAFAAASGRRGLPGLAAALARALTDLTRHALAERWAAVRGRPSGRAITARRLFPSRGPSAGLPRSGLLSVRHDVRLAWRAVRRAPGHAVGVVATLAVGVAATTAMFTVLHAVVLRPLPFDGSERAVRLCETHLKVAGFCVASAVNVEDWRQQAPGLEHAGVARQEQFALRQDGRLVPLRGAIATPGFFRVLGLRAAAGRLFDDADLQPGAAPVAVVSHAFWTSQLGADSAAIGRTVVLGGRPVRVAGVLAPEAFVPDFPGVEVWQPLPASVDDVTRRDWRGFTALGRMRPGGSIASLVAELEGVRLNLSAAYPADNADWGIRVVSLRDAVAGPAAATLWWFMAAAILLWLVACVNVASLTMMRATRRAREFAVRTALGASRGRLGAQLLVESLMLSITSGAIGLALATAATRALLRVAPPDVPRLGEVSVDLTVGAFAAAASVAAAAAFAIAALVRVSRLGSAALGAGARQTEAPAASRAGMVVTQTAMAFVLVVATGTLTRAFVALVSWEPGFDRHGVQMSWLVAPPEVHRTTRAAVTALEAARDAVAALPGVSSAALASAGPLFGGSETGLLEVADRRADSIGTTVQWFDVDPRFFGTIGRPIVRGRGFEASDDASAPAVAVVNETLARRVFAGENPIGRRIQLASHTSEIVGVVGDVRPTRPDAPVEPEVFWPIRQYPRYGAFLVVRTGPGGPLEAATRAAIARTRPDMQVGALRSLDTAFERTLVAPRFSLLLIGAFGACAAALAFVGLYAAVASGLASRTRAHGVRLALGATPARLVRGVIGHTLRVAGLGIAIGAAAAIGAGRVAAGLLPGVPPYDLAALTIAVAAFVIVAVVAALLPARRVVRLDPVKALRAD